VPRELTGRLNVLPLIQLRIRMPFIDVELKMAGPSSARDERWKVAELFGDKMEDFAKAELEQVGLQKKMVDARNDWSLNGTRAAILQAMGRFGPEFC
jgi:hypothetical protein